MQQKKPSRRNDSRRGTTTVEFAIVAPIFFLLVLGMFELGRGLMVVHEMNHAARLGCRVGILGGKSNSDITATVNTTLSKLNISGDQITVLVNDGSGDAGTAASNAEITVKVQVPVSAVTWVPVTNYINGNLSGQYTLRKE